MRVFVCRVSGAISGRSSSAPAIGNETPEAFLPALLAQPISIEMLNVSVR